MTLQLGKIFTVYVKSSGANCFENGLKFIKMSYTDALFGSVEAETIVFLRLKIPTLYRVQWWNSERFGVITRQLQAAKCSLSCQRFGHIFTLLENLRCKQSM
jgi:hypothetical protein